MATLVHTYLWKMSTPTLPIFREAKPSKLMRSTCILFAMLAGISSYAQSCLSRDVVDAFTHKRMRDTKPVIDGGWTFFGLSSDSLCMISVSGGWNDCATSTSYAELLYTDSTVKGFPHRGGIDCKHPGVTMRLKPADVYGRPVAAVRVHLHDGEYTLTLSDPEVFEKLVRCLLSP